MEKLQFQVKVILLFTITLILGFLLPFFTKRVIRPSDEYLLSAQEFDRLQELADKKGDANASLRLALYYDRSSKTRDFEKMKFWLEKAANLGNKSAQELWQRLKEYSSVREIEGGDGEQKPDKPQSTEEPPEASGHEVKALQSSSKR